MPGLLEAPALLMPSEFPRMSFGGNSPFCIKTGAFEGHGCQVSPTTLTLRGALPSEPVRSHPHDHGPAHPRTRSRTGATRWLSDGLGAAGEGHGSGRRHGGTEAVLLAQVFPGGVAASRSGTVRRRRSASLHCIWRTISPHRGRNRRLCGWSATCLASRCGRRA
jgi:hypothetical protein